jgi:hypothetical protein
LLYIVALSDHHIAIVSIVFAAVALAASVASVLVAFHYSRRGEQREHERHDRERRADLEIVDASFEDLENKIRFFTVRVRNVGAASARRVSIVIVDGADPEPIRYLAHKFFASEITITAGETVFLELDAGLGLLSSWRFVLSWSDEAGDHRADGPMCPRSFHPRSGFGPLVPWEPTR